MDSSDDNNLQNGLESSPYACAFDVIQDNQKTLIENEYQYQQTFNVGKTSSYANMNERGPGEEDLANSVKGESVDGRLDIDAVAFPPPPITAPDDSANVYAQVHKPKRNNVKTSRQSNDTSAFADIYAAVDKSSCNRKP